MIERKQPEIHETLLEKMARVERLRLQRLGLLDDEFANPTLFRRLAQKGTEE